MRVQIPTLLLTFLVTISIGDSLPWSQLTKGTLYYREPSDNKPSERYILSNSKEIPPYYIPAAPSDPYTPQQVHLSIGNDIKQLTATWSTLQSTCSMVQFGIQGGQIFTTNGTVTKFIDGGSLQYTEYIHRATWLATSINSTQGLYRVGCQSNVSDWFEYSINYTTPNKPLKFALFGDMGLENAQSLPRLLQDVKNNLYDAILHIGDFAYDMADNNGTKGSKFMQMIQPIASGIPYMTTVGNHEEKYNFSHYKARFTMPGDHENLFYSYNVGPIHFVVISTEFYFYLNYGFLQIYRQYEWLEADLKSANEKRDEQPWLIVMGHRPLYCSNNDSVDCGLAADWLRSFIPPYGLDNLLHKYGVDLAIWAHEHSYERTWPVFDRKVYNGSYDNPYTNPGATVHIITGSAGCTERHDSFGPKKPFTAKQVSDYGYTRLTVFNRTTLYLEQISDDKQGAVVDTMTLIKDKHQPY